MQITRRRGLADLLLRRGILQIRQQLTNYQLLFIPGISLAIRRRAWSRSSLHSVDTPHLNFLRTATCHPTCYLLALTPCGRARGDSAATLRPLPRLRPGSLRYRLASQVRLAHLVCCAGSRTGTTVPYATKDFSFEARLQMTLLVPPATTCARLAEQKRVAQPHVAGRGIRRGGTCGHLFPFPSGHVLCALHVVALPPRLQHAGRLW